MPVCMYVCFYIIYPYFITVTLTAEEFTQLYKGKLILRIYDMVIGSKFQPTPREAVVFKTGEASLEL